MWRKTDSVHKRIYFPHAENKFVFLLGYMEVYLYSSRPGHNSAYICRKFDRGFSIFANTKIRQIWAKIRHIWHIKADFRPMPKFKIQNPIFLTNAIFRCKETGQTFLVFSCLVTGCSGNRSKNWMINCQIKLTRWHNSRKFRPVSLHPGEKKYAKNLHWMIKNLFFCSKLADQTKLTRKKITKCGLH